MPRPWPIGSISRIVADLDSGTKIAVSRIADRADRQVDPEHRAPVDQLDERTADDRAERHRDADDAAPDADRAGPLHPTGEHLRDDRHRDGVHHRAADRLQEARGDQRLDVGRQAAQQRCQREDRQPDLERAPAAEPVAGGAGQHQQRRQHQGVDVDDPLQLRRRRAEVGADVGNGDVDDRRVHRHDQQAQAAGHQDDGLAPSAQRPDDSFIHTTIVKLQLSEMQASPQ